MVGGWEGDREETPLESSHANCTREVAKQGEDCCTQESCTAALFASMCTNLKGVGSNDESDDGGAVWRVGRGEAPPCGTPKDAWAEEVALPSTAATQNGVLYSMRIHNALQHECELTANGSIRGRGGPVEVDHGFWWQK